MCQSFCLTKRKPPIMHIPSKAASFFKRIALWTEKDFQKNFPVFRYDEITPKAWVAQKREKMQKKKGLEAPSRRRVQHSAYVYGKHETYIRWWERKWDRRLPWQSSSVRRGFTTLWFFNVCSCLTWTFTQTFMFWSQNLFFSFPADCSNCEAPCCSASGKKIWRQKNN